MKLVITGVGAVSVAGVGSTALWDALKGPPPPSPTADAGKLDLTQHLKAAKTYLDRNSQLALLAASTALDEAGLGDDREGLNVGVSFGTAFGNLQTTETFLTMLRQKGPKLASPLLFIHSYPNTSSSLMAIEWTLTGPALNFCTGSRAGLDAILAGIEAVRDGKADVMLVGAAEAGGQLLQACQPHGDFREAAGMFTLETERTAHQREAVILAELAAWEQGADAATCVEKALAEAGIAGEQIGMVIMDKCDNDTESAQEDVWILNKYIGRTLSAGAPLGIIAAARAIETDKTIPHALVVSAQAEPAALVLKRYG